MIFPPIPERAVTISTEDDGPVRTILLDRPAAMNALSRALRDDLCTAIRMAQADDSVRVILLSGAGGRAFCVGLDLKELASREDMDAPLDADIFADDVVAAIERCRKPVIGAINGPAIAGGFELALSCDMLIASETASFADTHVRVGLLPGWGLSQKLSRMIGIGRAKELSLSGNSLDAATACAWGLVNRVVPADRLLDVARQLAHDIAKADPEAVRGYKRLIDEGFALSYGEARAFEAVIADAANGEVSARQIADRWQALIARGREQKSPAG